MILVCKCHYAGVGDSCQHVCALELILSDVMEKIKMI